MVAVLRSAGAGGLLVLLTLVGGAVANWYGEPVAQDALYKQDMCPDYALYATYPQ